RLVVGAAVVLSGRVELADAGGIVGVVDVDGIGGVDEDEVRARRGQRGLAGIGLPGGGAAGGEVGTEAGARQVGACVERRSAAAHGVDDGVVLAGVSLEDLPDDPRRGCAGILAVALHGGDEPALAARSFLILVVVLTWVLPERGGEDAQWG